MMKTQQGFLSSITSLYFNPPSEERVIQSIPLITYHETLLSKSFQTTGKAVLPENNTDTL